MNIISRILITSLLFATLYGCSSKKSKGEPRLKMYLQGLGLIKGPFKEIKETIAWKDNKPYTTTYVLDTASRVLKIIRDDGVKEIAFLNREYRTDSMVTDFTYYKATSIYWHTPFYDDKVVYQKYGNERTDTTYYTIDSSDKSRTAIRVTTSRDPASRTTNYYDKEGFFVEIHTTNNSSVDVRWFFRYDKNGDIIWQSEKGKSGGFEATATYSDYDDHGNWTKKKDEFINFPNGEKSVMTVTRKISY